MRFILSSLQKNFQLKTNAEDEKFLHWQFGAPVIVWCCIQKVLQYLWCVMCVCLCVCVSVEVCVRMRLCACVGHSIFPSCYNYVALQLQW